MAVAVAFLLLLCQMEPVKEGIYRQTQKSVMWLRSNI